MDTGTHFVVGLGLAGLAYIDPVVANDPSMAIAVMIGTVAGSQAPDADGLLRFKGNGTYIKNHRGLSHSLPALLIWTLLISGSVKLLFPQAIFSHLLFWTFLAVVLHVFSDMFNSYGTQAYRPLSEKWVSWNIIHIFDPVIFISHVIAILLWVLSVAPPQPIFIALYILIALYYAWRSWTHLRLMKQLPKWDPTYVQGEQYTLIPTLYLRQWHVIKRTTQQSYVLGDLKDNQLKWIDKVRPANHPAVEASKNHPDVASFLYFSSYACPELYSHAWGYEVRWIDVRYRHRKQYPFLAVVTLDKNLKPLDSYVGWLNEERVEKRLGLDSY